MKMHYDVRKDCGRTQRLLATAPSRWHGKTGVEVCERTLFSLLDCHFPPLANLRRSRLFIHSVSYIRARNTYFERKPCRVLFLSSLFLAPLLHFSSCRSPFFFSFRLRRLLFPLSSWLYPCPASSWQLSCHFLPDAGRPPLFARSRTCPPRPPCPSATHINRRGLI